MKLLDAIGRVERDRPNEAGKDDLVAWINQLDMRFWTEQVRRHEGGDAVAAPDYSMDAAGDTELLIPSPWDEVYIHHLYACIDYRLGEMDRYNNSAILFQNAWANACKAWRRTHMPLQTGTKHVIYGKRRGNPECILS